MANKIVVGIDLGTTNSCIAVWKNGQCEVIANIPSCVGFSQDGILIGQSAIRQQCSNPANTIFEVKRIIGQSFETIENHLQYWPFDLKNWMDTNEPKYCVQLNGKEINLDPIEISAIILKQLKEDAERSTKQDVSKFFLIKVIKLLVNFPFSLLTAKIFEF